MDPRYESFCLADPLFYDSPNLAGGPGFEVEPPEGWDRKDEGVWLAYAPPDLRLPQQGWKIHASGCLSNAQDILTAVRAHCVPRRIAFKFLRSELLVLVANAKYAHRGASGKLATIYPADEAQLERVLTELGEALDGQAGPYILSDLRWGSGPLYVRYGAFSKRVRRGRDGRRELMIEDDRGRLVVDTRRPTFAVPEWVTLPAFLGPHLAERGAATVEEMPYRVERPLHFSNGGGVYLAAARDTGEPVVLKEARPHAGLSADRADAVARLERERNVLERLGDTGVVPRLLGHFTLGDHRFLALEHVEGSSLGALAVERHPLTRRDADARAVAEYAAWALARIERVEAAVAAVHDRGIVIGDLHPSNVQVRPDGRVVLIDMEAATEVGEQRPALGSPGFLAPAGRSGFEIDRYALACMRLSLFLPLTSLVALDARKAASLAEAVGELFPVPERFLSEAVDVIAGPAEVEPPAPFDDWRHASDSMARAILASATPEREDRLYPGDVAQFEPGGDINLATGAAGVLLALASVGVDPPPEHVDWLERRALAAREGAPLGLYEGLAGVAHVLARLGREGEAAELLDACRDRLDTDDLGLDLHGGLPGIALALDTEAALEIARAVTDRLGDEDALGEVSGGDHHYAGLMHGSAGPALMFVRLYERTGDEALLDLARTALLQDLRRCVATADGALQVREAWRTLPYLAEGSVGIGMVLDDYLAHRDDEELAEAAAAIRCAAEAPLYAESGLFRGRAGMILHLARCGSAEPHLAAQVSRLAWHAIDFRGELAFPGHQLLRLSMDLASGTAGVMLALGAALGEPRAQLPFLGAIEVGRPAAADGVILAAERR